MDCWEYVQRYEKEDKKREKGEENIFFVLISFFK